MSTTGKVLAKDLLMSIDDGSGKKTIGCAQSASMTFTSEMVETTCKGDTGWYDGLPGKKNWTGSVSGVYFLQDATGFDIVDFFDTWLADTKVTLNFGTQATGDAQFEGEAYITSVSPEGGDDGAASYSVEFQGVGAIAKVTVV